MNIPILAWKPGRQSKKLQAFLDRPAVDTRALAVARKALADIEAQGSNAVFKYAAKFDRGGIDARRVRVTEKEFRDALEQVDRPFLRAARRTRKNVMAFARAGMKKDWRLPTAHRGVLGEQFFPLDRVGLYIPAGQAPLVSTVLMTAPMAEAAGVPSMAACTPPDEEGRAHPYVLAALSLCGVREVYKLGGIQAIGAMAYDTGIMKPVLKIMGPGGPYVTAAKKLVYGTVDLDLVAGPSEIAVLADDSASPAAVTADLLSQAEHGTGHEKVLLVTTSQALAEEVARQLPLQADLLSRTAAIRRVLTHGAMIARVETLEAGLELCNLFAPEHMELIVRNASRYVKKVRTAGALFIGPWTPESAGDFAAGPSHVLPTGGSARIFSGLTVEDFRRRVSLIQYRKNDLRDHLPVIEAMGRVETLDAHVVSAQKRFE